VYYPSFIEYASGFPNRQAELDTQAFPNRVWERDIDLKKSPLGDEGHREKFISLQNKHLLRRS